MNHHSHDYPLEEMERISEPKLAKDCLNLEKLLEGLAKIPQTTEQEAEEWRRKRKRKRTHSIMEKTVEAIRRASRVL